MKQGEEDRLKYNYDTDMEEYTVHVEDKANWRIETTISFRKWGVVEHGICSF